MGKICKYRMERLEQRNVVVHVDCPNCGTARIKITSNGGEELWDEAVCPKCNSRLILDSLSITVMLDPPFENGKVIQSDHPVKEG